VYGCGIRQEDCGYVVGFIAECYARTDIATP
jgi:hypothetical protein